MRTRAGASATAKLFARALLLGFSLAHPASAHTPLLSQSEFDWQDPNQVNATLVFAWQDAVLLGRDTHGARAKSKSDGGAQSPFQSVVDSGVVVTADGERCAAHLDDAAPYQGDGFAFAATFRCRARPKRLSVELPLLSELPPEHRHLIRIAANGAGSEATLSRDRDSLELALPTATAAAAPAPPAPAFWHTARGAVALGVRHILTGWDHLLFLLGLGFGVRRLRDAILPISSFTVAHSLTLAAATLGLFTLSPRIVEPAIAASIAYVAFENVLRPAPAHRSAVTFAFGLIHGLGFAGALSGLSLERARLLPTLFGFNAGVELGQIVALSVFLPLVLFLEKRNDGRLAKACCVAIGFTGLVLCVARCF